jgi:transcriptional regulator
MYVNPLHRRLTDRETLFALMASHPLGAWVRHSRASLVANHVPFLLDRSRRPCGTLIGHVSRANSVWRELGSASASVVMFHGPRPTSRLVDIREGRSMARSCPPGTTWWPTPMAWARAVEDRNWVFDMLRRLTERHEAPRSVPWSVSDAPAPFMERMMRAIVGVEIPIDRLEGKLKASQDEAMSDRLGTVRGMREHA